MNQIKMQNRWNWFKKPMRSYTEPMATSLSITTSINARNNAPCQNISVVILKSLGSTEGPSTSPYSVYSSKTTTPLLSKEGRGCRTELAVSHQRARGTDGVEARGPTPHLADRRLLSFSPMQKGGHVCLRIYCRNGQVKIGVSEHLIDHNWPH
jgi:hypothetical protein